MSVNTHVTDYPRKATLVQKIDDEDSGLSFVIMHFKEIGDFMGFRGPATEEFFNNSAINSFNICDKSFTTFFRRAPDGPYLALSKPAYFNTNYTKNRSYGPFFVIAEHPDTLYFCLKGITGFEPLTVDQREMKRGESVDCTELCGWNVAIIKGSLSGRSAHSFLRIDTAKELVADEDSMVCFVKQER